MIVSVPGEMTEEMGRRVRKAVLDATASAGITTTVISGLANEYADYFTTPEEFDAQHYEGGATIYGRASSVAIQEALVALAGDLAAGKPAPAAYPYDPTNGVKPDGRRVPGRRRQREDHRPAEDRRRGSPTRRSPGRAGSAATTGRSTARS